MNNLRDKNFFIIFLIFNLHTYIIANNQEQITFKNQPKWSDDLDLDNIEKRLQQEEIINSIDIKKYKGIADENQNHTCIDNYGSKVYLITLASGLKGVFKIRQNRNYAEVAAYQASKYLNLRLV